MSNNSYWKRYGKRLLARGDEKRCHWCGEPVEDQAIIYEEEERTGNYDYKERLRRTASVDHVVPRSRGGTNALDNLVIACLPCNIGRGPGRKQFKKAKV